MKEAILAAEKLTRHHRAAEHLDDLLYDAGNNQCSARYLVGFMRGLALAGVIDRCDHDEWETKYFPAGSQTKE